MATKQFYACEHKREVGHSTRCQEWIEYDIDTLIQFEAESEIECDDEFADISDEEFVVFAEKRAADIKDELMRNGIYRNEFGQPVFLYC